MAQAVNDASHWREFENNRLSHSMAHYLMAIDRLRDEFGYARSTDVARLLNVSRGAASMALGQLRKRELVTEDPNRFLLLTEEGVRMAQWVEHNFAVLCRFFERVLGVENTTASADACKMEHLMSHETGRRLLWLMRYVLDDEELATRVAARMNGFQDECDALDGGQCPVCGGDEACLTASESVQDGNGK